MRSAVTVLMYHRVLEDADCPGYPFPSLVMPTSLFEAQLAYLSEHARVVTLANALAQLGASGSSSKPIVCLTFDDGYADNFEIVAPLLEARGFRGTFFITAGSVQAGEPLWYDLAAEAWTVIGAERARDRADDLLCEFILQLEQVTHGQVARVVLTPDLFPVLGVG